MGQKCNSPQSNKYHAMRPIACTAHFAVYHRASKADIGDCITPPSASACGRGFVEILRGTGKEYDGEVDRSHASIEYGPTVQLSVLVNSLKAVTWVLGIFRPKNATVRLLQRD